jgi:hypothetical protein
LLSLAGSRSAFSNDFTSILGMFDCLLVCRSCNCSTVSRARSQMHMKGKCSRSVASC